MVLIYKHVCLRSFLLPHCEIAAYSIRLGKSKEPWTFHQFADDVRVNGIAFQFDLTTFMAAYNG